MKEKWRDVIYRGESYKDYYQVSTLGNVRGVDRIVVNPLTGKSFVKGQTIVGSHDKDGYRSVKIHKKGKFKNAKVHRLVAEAFVPNPENKPEVNHINTIKKDNRVENLEWATRRENAIHAWENDLQPPQHGKRNPNVKITEKDVFKIRILREQDKTLEYIAEKTGTSISNVKNIVYGHTWNWLK